MRFFKVREWQNGVEHTHAYSTAAGAFLLARVIGFGIILSRPFAPVKLGSQAFVISTEGITEAERSRGKTLFRCPSLRLPLHSLARPQGPQFQGIVSVP